MQLNICTCIKNVCLKITTLAKIASFFETSSSISTTIVLNSVNSDAARDFPNSAVKDFGNLII